MENTKPRTFFKWKEEDKKALIQSAKHHFPWGQPHGKTADAWIGITADFNLYANTNMKMQTIKLKVESLLEDYKSFISASEKASGVVFVDTFLQKDIEDLLNKIDSCKEEKKTKKNELEKKRLENIGFGETIRMNSLKRTRTSELDMDPGPSTPCRSRMSESSGVIDSILETLKEEREERERIRKEEKEEREMIRKEEKEGRQKIYELEKMRAENMFKMLEFFIKKS